MELGRIDIHYHVSIMSKYLAAPREGHLEQVFCIFAYLKKNPQYRIVMDSSPIAWDEEKFPERDWSDFYQDPKEELPHNMPEPCIKKVQINCFVDADHAGDVVSRRSHTGILIYVNRAPVIWYSKRQNTVETSTFGSEFIALRIATEMIEGLRYKLRMFGVPLLNLPLRQNTHVGSTPPHYLYIPTPPHEVGTSHCALGVGAQA